MQSLGVRQLKKAFRKAHLQRLRSWAKAEPAQLQAASQQLCDHLYDYIQSRYRPTSKSQEPQASALCETAQTRGVQSKVSAAAPPLFIFAYLPLYYEVDLVPLMRRLWPTAHAQSIHILTPVVLPHPHTHSSSSATAAATVNTATSSSAFTSSSSRPPSVDVSCAALPSVTDPHQSAMVFVEVMDDEDLDTTFAPQGPFQIREFFNSLLMPWLMGPEAEMSDWPAENSQQVQLAKEKAERLRNEGRVRHMVLCDSYATLFPSAHAAGYRPAGLVDYTAVSTHAQTSSSSLPVAARTATSGESCATHVSASAGLKPQDGSSERAESLQLDDVAMLVLTPGVLFDVQTGRRIGKGCGYYDRFLTYHARHHALQCSAVPSTPHISSDGGGGNTAYEVMAVAFDSQVLHSKAAAHKGLAAGADVTESIPVDAHDQLVHTVVTPSGGVEVVGQHVP